MRTLPHATHGWRGGVGGGGLQLVTYLIGTIEQAEVLTGSIVQVEELIGTITYTEELTGVLDE